MKIFLRDLTGKLPTHLHSIQGYSVIPYINGKLRENVSISKINTNKSLMDIDTSFLFEYKIFPSFIMTFLTQWNNEGRQIRVGDTIVQQVYLPPFKFFSQKIIFGVRIKEIINNSTRIGFSYETLAGHVEKGISTFTIEENQEGLFFKAHTFSGPGNLLSMLVGPFFSRPYQAYCTNQAIKNVKMQIENQ